MELRKQGKDTFNERPGANECSQLQSSPCGRSTPPVRYPRIPPTRSGLSSASARARRIHFYERERGAKAVLSQAWSSHTASTRSPPPSLPVRYPIICLCRDTGVPSMRKSMGNWMRIWAEREHQRKRTHRRAARTTQLTSNLFFTADEYKNDPRNPALKTATKPH